MELYPQLGGRNFFPASQPEMRGNSTNKKKFGDFSSSKHNDVEFIGQLELALQWHLHIDKNTPLPMKVGDLLHRHIHGHIG